MKFAASPTTAAKEIASILFSGDIFDEDEVKYHLNIYQPLWNLIDNSKTLGWAVGEILELRAPEESMNEEFKEFKKSALSPIGLLSVFF